MLTLLGVFLTMVIHHSRLVEIISRLDFLWKQQAARELEEMLETRHNNMQLLRNILPEHVATHFLSQDRPPEVRVKDLTTFKGLVLACCCCRASRFSFSAAGALLAGARQGWGAVCQHPQLHRVLQRGRQQGHGVHSPPQRNHRYVLL